MFRCPVAFYHLRMGETLMTAGVMHAHDHFIQSQRLFHKSDNRSTGEVQLNLALATYYAVKDKDKKPRGLKCHQAQTKVCERSCWD